MVRCLADRTFQLRFAHLWNSIVPGGVYVIEDIETSYWHLRGTVYNYRLEGETSLVDTFTTMARSIADQNVDFSNGYSMQGLSDVFSISFSRNLIVIKKRKYGSREGGHGSSEGHANNALADCIDQHAVTDCIGSER